MGSGQRWRSRSESEGEAGMKEILELLAENTPKILSKKEMDPATVQAYKEGMKMVVNNPNGTAFSPLWRELPVTVAGKTGTAEESRSRANHALFVSYAPYDNPEITVSTRIAFGYTSEYAANLTRDIYKYYFGLAEEDDILTGTAAIPDAEATTAD